MAGGSKCESADREIARKAIKHTSAGKTVSSSQIHVKRIRRRVRLDGERGRKLCDWAWFGDYSIHSHPIHTRFQPGWVWSRRRLIRTQMKGRQLFIARRRCTRVYVPRDIWPTRHLSHVPNQNNVFLLSSSRQRSALANTRTTHALHARVSSTPSSTSAAMGPLPYS